MWNALLWDAPVICSKHTESWANGVKTPLAVWTDVNWRDDVRPTFMNPRHTYRWAIGFCTKPLNWLSSRKEIFNNKKLNILKLSALKAIESFNSFEAARRNTLEQKSFCKSQSSPPQRLRSSSDQRTVPCERNWPAAVSCTCLGLQRMAACGREDGDVGCDDDVEAVVVTVPGAQEVSVGS